MDYRTIAAPAKAEFTEKRSRFIASLAPAATRDEALRFIETVKKSNKEAAHNVYAYITGEISRFSDDGEPQGTAGLPALEVLKNERLTDVAVVVTRYFGGILLGAGGLMRAYRHAVKMAAQSADILYKTLYSQFRCICGYADYSKICALVNQLGGSQEAPLFGEKIRLTVFVPDERAQRFQTELRDLTAGAVNAEFIAKRYQ